MYFALVADGLPVENAHADVSAVPHRSRNARAVAALSATALVTVLRLERPQSRPSGTG